MAPTPLRYIEAILVLISWLLDRFRRRFQSEVSQQRPHSSKCPTSPEEYSAQLVAGTGPLLNYAQQAASTGNGSWVEGAGMVITDRTPKACA
jgi:hypothetical protein